MLCTSKIDELRTPITEDQSSHKSNVEYNLMINTSAATDLKHSISNFHSPTILSQ